LWGAACFCDGKPEQVSMNLNKKKKWDGSLWTASDFTHLKHWESWKLDLKILSSHGAASRSKWQHSTVHKYEKNCRKLMLELHCLGACTVLLRLKLSDFHIFAKLKEIPEDMTTCGTLKSRQWFKLWFCHNDAQFSHNRLTWKLVKVCRLKRWLGGEINV
jgi:hypothetical protein